MKKMNARILMTIMGVLLGGICVAMMRMAEFGIDPYQVLMSGIEKVTKMDFGLLNVLVNGLTLILVFFLAKRYIGVTTFINMFLLGFVIDGAHGILLNLFPEVTFVGRILFFLIGIFILCFASSFYYTANLGVSTYDAVALMWGDQGKLHFKYCRIITDLCCVTIGFALIATATGGTDLMAEVQKFIGLGTIITAFCMGPLIDYFRRKVSDPILAKCK